MITVERVGLICIRVQTFSLTIALAFLLMLCGCGKTGSPVSDSNAAPAPSVPIKQTKEDAPVVGKWVTDTGHVLEFRADGRCIIEPFSGNQLVGTYAWTPATKELIVSVNPGFGKVDALWQVQGVSEGSLIINVREEQVLGTRGQITLTRYSEGQPELQAEGQTLRSVESIPIELKAQIKFANVGTGTLILKMGGQANDAGHCDILFSGQSVSYSVPMQSILRYHGDDFIRNVAYAWKKPSGQLLGGQVECKVVIEEAKPTLLQVGKPAKVNSQLNQQWFQFEVEGKDAEGNSPGMYALFQTPNSPAHLYGSDKTSEPPVTVYNSYRLGEDAFDWVIGKTNGTCLWRIDVQGREQTVVVLSAKYVLREIERGNSGSRTSFLGGTKFTLDGSQCPGSDPTKHTGCWAAISFQAKAGRHYVNSFSNSVRSFGHDATCWFMSDEQYQQFKSENAIKGMDFYGFKGDKLGTRYSTLNPDNVPLWTAPSDGTFWILLHYGPNNIPDECQAWIYEIGAM